MNNSTCYHSNINIVTWHKKVKKKSKVPCELEEKVFFYKKKVHDDVVFG